MQRENNRGKTVKGLNGNLKGRGGTNDWKNRETLEETERETGSKAKNT